MLYENESIRQYDPISSGEAEALLERGAEDKEIEELIERGRKFRELKVSKAW